MKKVWLLGLMILAISFGSFGAVGLDWESGGLYGAEILKTALKDHPYLDEMLLTDAPGQQAFLTSGYLYYLNKADLCLYRTDQEGNIHEKIGPYSSLEKVYPSVWWIQDRLYFQGARLLEDNLYEAVIVGTDLDGHDMKEVTKTQVMKSQLNQVTFHAYGDHFFVYPQLDVEFSYFRVFDTLGQVVKFIDVDKVPGRYINGQKGILPTSAGLVISGQDEIRFIDGNLEEKTLMRGRDMTVAALPDQPYAYIYKNQMLHIIHLTSGEIKLHPMVRPMRLLARNQKTGNLVFYTSDVLGGNTYRLMGQDLKNDFSVGGHNVGGLYKSGQDVLFSARETLYAFTEDETIKTLDHLESPDADKEYLYRFGQGYLYGYYMPTTLRRQNTDIAIQRDTPIGFEDGQAYEDMTSEKPQGPGVFVVYSWDHKGPEGVYFRDAAGQETMVLAETENQSLAFRSLYDLGGYAYFEYGKNIYRLQSSDLSLELLKKDVYTLKVLKDTVLLSTLNNHHYHPYMYYFKNSGLIEVDKETFKPLDQALGGFDVSVNSKTTSGYKGSVLAGDNFFFTMKDGNVALYDMVTKSSKPLTLDFRVAGIFASTDQKRVYMTSQDDHHMYVYDLSEETLTQRFALGVDYVYDDGQHYMISGDMLPLNVVYEMDVHGESLTLQEDYNRYKAFYDVPIEADVLNYQLMALRNAGLVTGSNGQALLDKSLTRAEAITLIVKMIEMTEGPIDMSSEVTYTDVSEKDWFHDFVLKATSLNLTSGVGNNLFDPYGKVTDTQFALMLGKLFYKDHGYQLPESYPAMDWKAAADQLSKTYDLKSTTLVNGVITRAQAFGMLYKAYDFLDETYFWFE